jgi:hypothetical protein
MTHTPTRGSRYPSNNFRETTLGTEPNQKLIAATELMNPKAKLTQAKELIAQAERLREEVYQVQCNCRHQWSEARYAPDHQEAYEIPGDPPGTMGVDWRPACHVPAKTTPKWVRTCTLCELEQSTTSTKLGAGTNGLRQEVPDFGS